MSEYVIGPGVAEAIAANNDEPRADEEFIILDPGHKVSQTFAKLGIYYWLEEDNAVRRAPFPG